MKIDRYRSGIASLLSKLVVAVGEIERWLDFAVDGDEGLARHIRTLCLRANMEGVSDPYGELPCSFAKPR